MYRIVQGSTQNLPDVEAFIETLNALGRHLDPRVRTLFDPQAEVIVTRAPGRLDLMGGIADYSGSLVLQLPIREATLVALQRDASRGLEVISLGPDPGRIAIFQMRLEELEPGGRPLEYGQARRYFRQDPARHWAAYVAGCFLVLMRERGVQFRQGARLLISSQVPQGVGVSSSAALEVAVMQALAVAFGVALEPRELALLCQRVENRVAGAPCGVMDQMTAVCGQAHRLLALLCQPAELRGSVEVPEQVEVWGLDSGVRHSVSGADYASVRAGAFMGYRVIAELAGLKVEPAESEGHVRVIDPKWSGYLANLPPAEFERQYAGHLPERLLGSEFLRRFQGSPDPVTAVDPRQTYPVLRPTAHPVYEHARVAAFAELLGGAFAGGTLGRLGGLMYQSHASYSACGLGSDGTDLLVELARAAGPAQGLYGAKITGGGSGGTVAVLGRRGAGAAVQALAEQYERRSGHRPVIFAGSSPGAAAFGHIKLVKPGAV